MSKQSSSIDVPVNVFIRFWLVMVGFLLTLVALYLVRNALIIIGISAFLAMALNPPVNAISRLLPSKSRIGATALAYVVVVFSLLGFLLTVLPTIIEQMARFIRTLPAIIENFGEQTRWINDIVQRYGLQQQYQDALTNIQSEASHVASQAGGSVISSVGSIVGAFITVTIILVLTFLMLVEGPIWMRRIWGVYRDTKKRSHHQQLVKKMYRVVTGYVNGQVIISAISGTCSLVVVVILSTIFDAPANLAIPIGVILFVMGLIPMFGATIGAAIAGILLAINSPGAAIAFLVYYFIYQQIENNFISPTIQSRTVEISALSVLVALTIGLSLFGLLGGLISIPIAGCIRILVLDYVERRQA
jgi:predicted PurR-regulated permease PerM